MTTTQLYPECDVAKETFLLLHVYPCLLLALTFLYGMSVFRSIFPSKYFHSSQLFFSAGSSVTITRAGG